MLQRYWLCGLLGAFQMVNVKPQRMKELHLQLKLRTLTHTRSLFFTEINHFLMGTSLGRGWTSCTSPN